LLRVAARNLQLRLRTAAPGTIVTFNASTQKADVRLDHKPIFVDPRSPLGERPAATIILKSVPVYFPRGMSGTAYDTIPIQAGDTGQLISCDRSLETWLRLGTEVDPVSLTLHSLADSVFYPGLHPDTAPITPPVDLTARVIEAPLIKLGRNAVDFAALGTTLVAAIDAFLAAGVPVAMDGGANLKATMIASWNALKVNVLSAKNQVE
jgi:hypothetical protein